LTILFVVLDFVVGIFFAIWRIVPYIRVDLC
jgi:hypothetical protein